MDTFTRITALLDGAGAAYRVVEHEPEGRTEIITRIRGNRLGQAAKAMVVMVKIGKKDRRYYLAVVPGDRKLDLGAVRALCQGTHAMFAPQEVAERLTACVAGAIPPFSFDEGLELVVDPALLESDEIVFNAGRLDRSVFLRREDFVKVASPGVRSIAAPRE